MAFNTKYAVAVNEACLRSSKIHCAFACLIAGDSDGELVSRWLKRAKRELIQRECARRRHRIALRSLPRFEREQAIREARDAKYAAVFDSGVEFQSGFQYGALAAVGLTAAAGVYYATRYAARAMTEQLDELTTRVTQRIADSNTVVRFEELVESATTTSDAIGGTFAPIAELLKGIQTVVRSIVDIIKTVGGAFWKLAVGAFVISVRSLAAIHDAIKSFIVELVTRLMPDLSPVLDFEGMVMQQDGDLLSKIVAMTACFVTAKGDSPMNMFLAVMGRIGSFPRTAQGIEGVFNTALMMLEKSLNTVLGLIGRDGVKLVGVAARSVMDWCNEVDTVFCKIDTENPSIADLNHAKALLVTGYNLKNTLQAPYLRDVLGRQLDKLNGRLAAHRGLLEIENTYRQQPTLVMFGGASAVGKTFLIKNFASAALVLSKLCKPKECAQNMWQKGEDRFFNGYCGQLVYIMDDVFQKKSVKGSDECEGMTIIRAVNSWPFPLPFADVESKGRYFFNSKLMIGTTNQANIKTDLEQVLAQPEAVLRRITHGYWLTVNPEFGIPVGSDGGGVSYRLDYKKWERVRDERRASLAEKGSYTVDDQLATIPWEAWRLHKCDFDGSPSTVEGPSVFALVKQVAQELRDGARYHDHSVKQLDSWLAGFEEAVDFEAYGEVVAQSGVSTSCGASAGTGSFFESEQDDLVNYWQSSVNTGSSFSSEAPSAGEFSSEDAPSAPGPLPALSLQAPIWMQALLDANNQELNWRVRTIAHIKYCVLGLSQPERRIDATLGLISWVATLVAGVRIAMVIGRACQSLLRTLWGVIFPHSAEDVIDTGVEPQSVHRDPKVYPRKKSASKAVPSAVAQLGNPPQNTLTDIVYRNTWKMLADGKVVGQVLFLRASVGVMPWHFRKDLCEASSIEMISCGAGGLRVSFTGKDFAAYPHVSYQTSDLEFVDFSTVCTRAHRDIVKYCVLDRDVTHDLVGSNDLAVRLDVARTYQYNGVFQLERTTLVTRGLRHDPVLAVGARDVDNVWAYGVPTECGDCGAPLTFAEPRFFGGKAILGIHIAGRTRAPGNGGQREGWSAILTQELALAALRSFKGVIKDNFVESMQARGIVVDESLADVVEESGLAAGSMAAIGMVPEDKVVSQSTRSKIRRTGFEGFGPCPVAPAHLSPVVVDGEIVEPMHVAMANYQSAMHASRVPNDAAIMALAMRRHTQCTEQSTRRILGFEEAIVGVPHMKLKSINRSSSAGYPYNLDYARGKRDIFGDDDEYDLHSDAVGRLRRDVDRILDAARRGEREAHVFVDFLKDETRPLAKVQAVATRAISGAPLDYSICCRMYFGAFMSSVYLNHTVCGMAPGINYYTEWDMLAHSLLRPGGRVFAGDFKAFDASEQPDVLLLCLEHINNWYARFEPCDEDNLVRRVLFEDLIHSRHLTGIGCLRDSLVQWNKSLPSGHPLTTIINSMYSLYTLTACYVLATGDYTNMWDRVYICTYGDDNVVGVSDEVSEIFNQETVAGMMRDVFKLTYTSDKKGSELKPYETINDITFLKRRFVRAECDGGWAAPLDMNSILYRTYFYRNERSFVRDQAQNFADALMELSLHDESEWSERYYAAAEYCVRQGIPLPIVSRDQARQMCFARTDVWF